MLVLLPPLLVGADSAGTLRKDLRTEMFCNSIDDIYITYIQVVLGEINIDKRLKLLHNTSCSEHTNPWPESWKTSLLVTASSFGTLPSTSTLMSYTRIVSFHLRIQLIWELLTRPCPFGGQLTGWCVEVHPNQNIR